MCGGKNMSMTYEPCICKNPKYPIIKCQPCKIAYDSSWWQCVCLFARSLCQCRSSLVYGLSASIAAACMCTYAQTSPLSAVLGPCCVWIMLQWRQKLRGPNLCGDGLRREPVPPVARRSQAWACVHGGACSVSACGGHCFDLSARSPSLLAWLGV